MCGHKNVPLRSSAPRNTVTDGNSLQHLRESTLPTGCSWPMTKCDSAANTGLFMKNGRLLRWLTLAQMFLEWCCSLRLPFQYPFLVSSHPSKLSSPPSAPSPFSLTGIFLNKFLACLILSWHLFLEGLELIQEPVQVKQKICIILTTAYFQII